METSYPDNKEKNYVNTINNYIIVFQGFPRTARIPRTAGM